MRLVTVSTQGVYRHIHPLFSSMVSYNPKLVVTSEDMLLLEGGTDVNPSLYGQEPGVYTDPSDTYRDRFEIAAFEAIQKVGGAVYGVCRGSQLLTVLSGGKLIQHVSGHGGESHNIDTFDGETIKVTSTHHQMMAPYKSEHKLLGWSSENRSKVYSGETTNASLDLLEPDMFLEPEIVWYPKTRGLAVQGHPEYLPEDDKFPQYCTKLIKQFIFEWQESYNLVTTDKGQIL